MELASPATRPLTLMSPFTADTEPCTSFPTETLPFTVLTLFVTPPPISMLPDLVETTPPTLPSTCTVATTTCLSSAPVTWDVTSTPSAMMRPLTTETVRASNSTPLMRVLPLTCEMFISCPVPFMSSTRTPSRKRIVWPLLLLPPPRRRCTNDIEE